MVKNPERNNYCLDLRQKLLWVRVPKVASTSIRMSWYDSLPNVDYKRALKATHCYKVIFVRDPVDRFQSALRSQFRKYLKHPSALLDLMSTHEPMELDKHIRPQWCFAEGLNIDFIGHFETLVDDWEKLSRKFHVKPLPHKNKTVRDAIRLTDMQIDHIRDFYQKDYDLYYR